MTKHFLLASTVAAILLGSGMAQAQNADPSAVQAGAYKLETSHARVVFSLSHMGFSTWYGDLPGATGSLSLDPKTPATAQLDVTIPVANVVTTNAKVDEELKSKGWFDAATYPTITFHSTSVTVTGPTTANVTGDLTFHGVTKPITLDATFKASGTNMLTRAFTIGFEVRGKLKRSDYGVRTYVPLIGDDVDLMISAPFEKK